MRKKDLEVVYKVSISVEKSGLFVCRQIFMVFSDVTRLLQVELHLIKLKKLFGSINPILSNKFSLSNHHNISTHKYFYFSCFFLSL